MSFFDKIKDFNEMRKQAQEIQSVLGKEVVTGTSNDGNFTVTMDGNQNVLKVEMKDTIVGDKFAIEKSSKEAFSKALDALKKLMVSKLSNVMK